jgi:hypothetical protein
MKRTKRILFKEDLLSKKGFPLQKRISSPNIFPRRGILKKLNKNQGIGKIN